MKEINISYNSFDLILRVLENKLSKKRRTLKEMVNDKNCSAEIYNNTVDECRNIEYAITELQKEIKK
tara:strand:- start:35 stop:235 length:201 start_codon:yes stop_codon:yes gene_type:complete